LIDASERWRGIEVAHGDLEKLNELRAPVAPLAISAQKDEIGLTPDARLQVM
jgi:hypothetical protein